MVKPLEQVSCFAGGTWLSSSLFISCIRLSAACGCDTFTVTFRLRF